MSFKECGIPRRRQLQRPRVPRPGPRRDAPRRSTTPPRRPRRRRGVSSKGMPAQQATPPEPRIVGSPKRDDTVPVPSGMAEGRGMPFEETARRLWPRKVLLHRLGPSLRAHDQDVYKRWTPAPGILPGASAAGSAASSTAGLSPKGPPRLRSPAQTGKRRERHAPSVLRARVNVSRTKSTSLSQSQRLQRKVN